jgi:hypothetical protein
MVSDSSPPRTSRTPSVTHLEPFNSQTKRRQRTIGSDIPGDQNDSSVPIRRVRGNDRGICTRTRGSAVTVGEHRIGRLSLTLVLRSPTIAGSRYGKPDGGHFLDGRSLVVAGPGCALPEICSREENDSALDFMDLHELHLHERPARSNLRGVQAAICCVKNRKGARVVHVHCY